jgi:hypothetical protein
MKIRVAARGCPVCGFPDFDALDGRSTTFEICPSCGVESGYAYQEEIEEEHLLRLRRHWFIEEEGRWWSSNSEPPEGWNPHTQLLNAGLSIPSPNEKPA